MNNSIGVKMKKMLAAAVVIAIAAFTCSILIMSRVINNGNINNIINDERVLTNGILNLIEKDYSRLLSGSTDIYEELTKELVKINSRLQLVDLSGKVIFSSEDKHIGSKNTILNIKEAVGYDKSFMTNDPGQIKFTIPVVVDGQQRSNAVFIISRKGEWKRLALNNAIYSLLPMAVAVAILIGLIAALCIRIWKEVLEPIKELNTTAECIAAGNLERKIKYSDDSELGRFCSSFEFMRDELKSSLEKQRELEKSRKELIACISHDLRTPIASIKAYVDGLREGIAKNPEAINRYVNVIGKKTEDLIKLINDLFEHSQTELGELKINLQEHYSGEILNKIVQPIRLELKENGHDFQISEPLPDVLVRIDPLRIEQVIMNLIQNARKYTPKGGSIYFSAEISGKFIKITVRDTGIGISARDLPLIFEKFYRGEKSRSRDHGGAGLGLSICKYIVEAHGGTITAESRENEGSTFSFYVPKL